MPARPGYPNHALNPQAILRRTASILPLLLFCFISLGTLCRGAENPSLADENLRIAEGLFQRGLYSLAEEAFADWCRNHPQHQQFPFALFRQAEALRLQNRFDNARPIYRALAEAAPSSTLFTSSYRDLALFRLGEHELATGRGAEAANFFSAIRPANLPESLRNTHLIYWGRASYSAGQTAAAQGIFQQMIDSNAPAPAPAVFAQALFFLGRIAMEQERWEEALGFFQKLAGMKDVPPELEQTAELQITNLLYRLQEYAQAAEAGEAFLKSRPDHPQAGDVLKTTLWAYLGSHNYEAILRHLAPTAPRQQDPDFLYLMAHAYRNEDRLDLALRFYDRLQESPRASSDLREKAAWEGALTAARTETPSQIIQRINGFAQQFPQSIHLPELFILAARTYLQAGQAQSALKAIDGATSRLDAGSPLLEASRAMRADVLFQAGQFEKAASSYSDLRRDDPNSDQARAWYLAEIRALNAAGMHQKAVALISNSERILPDITAEERESILFETAVALAGTGETRKMLSVLEQYLNLPSPRKHAGKAQFLKGIRLYLDRNFEEAATAFQQAIQDPTLPPELVAQAQTQLAASWQELGQPDKAADLFSRSIAQGNADQLSDQTLLWLAHFHLEADRFEAAMAPLKPLMQRELPPKLKQAGLLARGYALLGLGQLDEAETALEQAMDLDSANQTGIEAALALADVSRADPAGLERAKELFASARDQAGGYWPELAARARFGLGQVALDMQQPAEAAKQFMGLAILYDIPDLTPRALALAAEAFQASGQPEAADEASAELKKRYPAFGSQPNSSSQNR